MSKPIIKIRPYALEDAEARYHVVIESQEHLLPWIPWAKNYTLDACKKWIEKAHESWQKEKDYCFAITDENDQYMGEVKLLNVQRDYFENKAAAAYWIGKSYVGKGIAGDALKWVAQFAFRELKLSRVEVMIMPENEKSLRVARKAGAKEEGLLRNQWIFEGEPQEVILFSFIPSDFDVRSNG